MLAKTRLDPWDDTSGWQSAHDQWTEFQAKKLAPHFAGLIESAPKQWAEASPDTFDWWHVLVTAPNRERIAAERLERLKVLIYLPLWSKKAKCRGKSHAHRLCAVVPGLLFAPVEIMGIARRDDALEWAGVRDFYRTSDGYPERVSKAEIEKIRTMEAKLNLPPERKGVLFEIGQMVRFADNLFEDWGTGTIFEIASEARIGVEVKALFGRRGKIYVTASEIEAM